MNWASASKATCLILPVAIILLAPSAIGSGVYLPPRAPVLRQLPALETGSSFRQQPTTQRAAVAPPISSLNRVEVLQGKEYFNAKLFSSSGKFCVECHGLREDFPLQRDSLQAKAGQLSELVHICLVEKQRSGGTSIPLDSREVRALKAYLVSSYRLTP